MDYFGARYYSGAQGRFTSPDTPLLSRVDTPQKWNLYAYTANNPLRRVDPDGRNWFNVDGSWTWYDGANVNSEGKGCKKGTDGCMHSDYTNLIVFDKTGTNEYGAQLALLPFMEKGTVTKSQSQKLFTVVSRARGQFLKALLRSGSTFVTQQTARIFM